MKLRLLTGLALALALFAGATAQAGIVYDSITGSTAAGEVSITPPTGPLGISFSTLSSASVLSDVKVVFYNPSSSGIGSVTVSLYASNGLAPIGNPLATIGTVSTSAVTPGTFLTEDFSGLAPIGLSANARYYIILSTTSSSPLQAVATANLTGTEVATEFNYYSGTAQSNVSIGGTFEFQVSTLPNVVPEPSSLLLCAIAGLGGLAYRVRRRSLAAN